MFDYSKSTLALLALSYSEGTAEQKKDILTKISPEDIFDLKFKGVFNNDLTESIKNTIKGISYILSELDSANVRLLSVYDEEYPNSLKNIESSPPNST